MCPLHAGLHLAGLSVRHSSPKTRDAERAQVVFTSVASSQMQISAMPKVDMALRLLGIIRKRGGDVLDLSMMASASRF